METLTVSKSAVLSSYKSAKGEARALLQDLFGKQVYDDITDRVKSFEDACQVLGISTATPDVSKLPMKHQIAIISNYKLTIIAEAINEGWVPDWNNSNDYKYYPYFKMNNGSGLAFSYCAWAHTHSIVGSRLCVSSSEEAEHVGETFLDLWSEWLLG